ncbi:MAG: aspartate aminotransferase family protein [Chloroflexi bacterium]|nr:aspartate aminotransferase family protein [Chloroflexota bacterium]
MIANNHAALVQQDERQLHPMYHPTRTENAVMVERGEGVWLYTTDGRKILDSMASLWNVNVGYGNRKLAKVAYEQMLDIAYSSGFAGMTNPPSAQLADKLAGFFRPNMNFTNFTSGGSESSDTSFKTARFYWHQLGKAQKKKIISRLTGYHGMTLAATSATGMSKFHSMFGGVLDGFVHVANPNPYRYEGELRDGETVAQAAARALEETILREGPETVAAFISEPIQGAGGVMIADDGYFDLVQAICKKYEVLFIVDEVICGFGRTGNWFGSDAFNINPDIMQFAKGVTSGYMPLGGIQVTDEIRDVINGAPEDQSWMHGYTYSGHAAACAVGIANIDIIERDGLLENSQLMGARLLEGLEALVDEFPHIDYARGLGLMAAVNVVKSKESREPDAGLAEKISDAALELGLRARPIGEAIAFAPPLCITADEVDIIVNTMGDAITRASG